MARDRVRYNRLLSRWSSLKEQHELSVAESDGTTAIMCSYKIPSFINNEPYKGKERDLELFTNEANDIASLLESFGRKVMLMLDSRWEDYVDAIRDREISDMCLIGHGNLGGLMTSRKNSSEYRDLDWEDIGTLSDHLKTGSFVQRFCGGYQDKLTVPLGTFLMSDHRNVLAPVGSSFEPDSITHQDNDLIVPVSEVPEMSYRYVKSNFKVQKFS